MAELEANPGMSNSRTFNRGSVCVESLSYLLDYSFKHSLILFSIH